MYYEAAVGVFIMATAQCSFSCLIVSIWQAEASSFHVRPYNKRLLSHCYGAFYWLFLMIILHVDLSEILETWVLAVVFVARVK